MSFDEIKAAALALPEDERESLLRLLDASIFTSDPLTSGQREDLEKREAEYDRHPNDVIDGETFMAELRARYSVPAPSSARNAS